MGTLTPELLLKAYSCGLFPMADSRDSDEVFWVDPERRGLIPLETFHFPKRLGRLVRSDAFRVTIDQVFSAVMTSCAAPARGRESTWINEDILEAYGALHRAGHAHSVECWQDGKLAGGLYGVSLGGAFFGESMFHHVRDASKVALVHLAARLKAGGYSLLDTQFLTAHLAQFGAIELPRARYQERLGAALAKTGAFYSLPAEARGGEVLRFL